MGDADQKALNALAKGAGITAIGMAVSKALTYLYRVSIARFVGPEAYGQLSLALMVVGVTSTVAYLSLGSGLRKFIPEFRVKDQKARVKGLVIDVLEISVPLSVLLFAALFLGADFIASTFFSSPDVAPLIRILALTVPLGTLSSAFFDTTLGFNKIIYKTATVRILQNAVQLVLTVALLLIGYEVAGAAWGMLAGSILAAALGLYFMEKKVGPILTANVKPVHSKKTLLRYSSPLVISGLLGTLLGWADTALLGYYMEDTQVGLYNAALPTAMLILLPHRAIGSLALTSFSELKEREEEKVEASLQTATRWVFSLVFPAFLILLLFSEQVLTLLWGSTYSQASIALSILAAGYLFDALVGRVGSFLQSKGHTRYILYNNTAALILNLGLNVALIPIYGIIGAAIATASSTALTNILMFAEVWRKERIVSIPYRGLSKILLAGLIPLSIVISVDWLLFASTPYWFLFPASLIYGGLYIFSYLLAVGIGEEEKAVVRRIGEKAGRPEEGEKVVKMLERFSRS